MGLGHWRDRTLQVVVDTPAAGINHVTTRLGSVGRARRKARLETYKSDRKLKKDMRASRFEQAYAAERVRLAQEPGIAKRERDQRIADEMVRLTELAIHEEARRKAEARKAEEDRVKAESLRQAEETRKAFEDLERKKQAAVMMLAEISEEETRLKAKSSLGPSPSKAADEPAPEPKTAAKRRAPKSEAAEAKADATQEA
jgi:hypothetical protein